MGSRKIHFEVSIDAKPEEVFDTMIDEKHYQEWVSAFNPTSHFVGSWEKNSKILFIGTDSKGNKVGMVARINENIRGERITIEHIGLYQDGQEILEGKEVDKWKGSLEEYFFSETENGTLLKVQMDSTEDFEEYFSQTWPKALEILKNICESKK